MYHNRFENLALLGFLVCLILAGASCVGPDDVATARLVAADLADAQAQAKAEAHQLRRRTRPAANPDAKDEDAPVVVDPALTEVPHRYALMGASR